MDWTPKPAPTKKGAHLYKHGMIAHPLYGRWRGMIQRCTDPNYKAYRHYGGRGITVCQRWLSFPDFLADMGEPPAPGMSIDRIDNDKGICARQLQMGDAIRTNKKLIGRCCLNPQRQDAKSSGLGARSWNGSSLAALSA